MKNENFNTSGTNRVGSSGFQRLLSFLAFFFKESGVVLLLQLAIHDNLERDLQISRREEQVCHFFSENTKKEVSMEISLPSKIYF